MHFNLFMYPTLPAAEGDRDKFRPIGRSTKHYQEMLDQIRELTIFAEQLGFDSVGFSEHHFHSEGWEISVNPLMLMCDLQARTQRIKFMSLGMVGPAWDPVRLAEETAMLDQLSKGRFLCGVARGYQARAVSVLGQHYHTTATQSDGSRADQINRAVHEEVIEILQKAWKNDVLTHRGKFYSVPPPDGFPAWPAAEVTAEQGAPGEIDGDGKLVGISVVPRPYQQPHPKIYQAFSISDSTISYAAERGYQPLILLGERENFKRLCHLYQDGAAEHGYQYKLGQNVGALRAVAFGETREQAMALFTDTQFKLWNMWFGAFGFWEAFRTPEDEVKYPFGKVMLPKSEWSPERLQKCGYAYIGTKDDIRRSIDDLISIHGQGGELETFCWLFDQGLMTMDEARRQMEAFAETILVEYGSAVTASVRTPLSAIA